MYSAVTMVNSFVSCRHQTRHSTIKVAFEGQFLLFTTQRPTSEVTAEDILERYSPLYHVQLELWNLERTAGIACHVTSPQTTPHQQVCSPGDPLITTVQPTPQEAYELGMHSPPAWLGESLCTCSRASWALFHCTDKLEVFRREDTEHGVRATAAFQEGSFVCEFEADVLTKAQFEVAEKEYQEQNIPVYGLQVQLLLSS
jgi:hypothetical protein